jgi:hypothetical protein
MGALFIDRTVLAGMGRWVRGRVHHTGEQDRVLALGQRGVGGWVVAVFHTPQA